MYSTELYRRIRAFLAAWPPSSPLPYVNELLKATADFERDLELWNIRFVKENLLYHRKDLCSDEKVGAQRTNASRTLRK